MELDWEAIEHEYVTTGISLRDLADKCGAVTTTIARHCKKGKWAKKREDYVHRVTTKCAQISADHDIAAIISQRGEIMKAYQKSIKALHRVVTQIADGEIVAPRDVTEVAKAITMYMDNDERLFGAKEEAPPSIEVIMTGKAKEWSE